MAAAHFSVFRFVIIGIFCLFMIILWLLWGVRKLKRICQFPSYAKVHAEYHCRTYFPGFCLYSISFQFLPKFWLLCKPRAVLASTYSFRKFPSLSFFTYNFFLIDCQIRMLQVHYCFLSLLTRPASILKEWINTNTSDKNCLFSCFFLCNTKSQKKKKYFFSLLYTFAV